MHGDKRQPKESKEEKMQRMLEMKRVLVNAIKMQALYSDRRIKIVETSSLIN
jgi:hypothetical protein